MRKGAIKVNFRLFAPIAMSIFAGFGVIGTSVLAVKATPKALQLIEEDKKAHPDEPQSKKDILRATWKCYLPAAGAGVATIGLIAGSTIMSHRAQLGLISAGAATGEYFRQYRKKVQKVVGEEKEKEILQEVARDKYTDCAFVDPDLIGVGSAKEALFYDPWGERYFTALTEDVRNAEYHVNRKFAFRGAAGVNDLYTLIGIEPLDYLRDVGWAVDEEFQWIDFEHTPCLMDDGMECYIISARYDPVAGYEYGYWDAWCEEHGLQEGVTYHYGEDYFKTR